MNKTAAPRKKPTSRQQRVKVPKLFLGVVFVIAALALAVLVWSAVGVVKASQDSARLQRIEAIYSSIGVDQDLYKLESYTVFGDKRPYDYDKSRSRSSVVEYSRGDTVDATFNELDGKIRAAGFTFFEEPYPGSVYKQFHYKSEKGEYVRLTVSSKPYDDLWRNATLMGKSVPEQLDDFDANQGPASVTLKVNLDDNNE